MSPLYVSVTPWGFMNSPLARPFPPITWTRSSLSVPVQLELQEWELRGLLPGVDLRLLTATATPLLLVLDRGREDD